MKRLAIILFAICFGLKSNAQIQTKFWGLELSSFYYESLETLEGRISDRCKYTQVRDNSIVAMDGKLGGYDWNFVTFRFYKGEFSRGLYAVSFSKNYETRVYAKPTYTQLLESLLATAMERYCSTSWTKELYKFLKYILRKRTY